MQQKSGRDEKRERKIHLLNQMREVAPISIQIDEFKLKAIYSIDKMG
jgi:hypothetical protein